MSPMKSYFIKKDKLETELDLLYSYKSEGAQDVNG